MTEFSSDYQPPNETKSEAVAQSNTRRKIVHDALMLALHREIDVEGKPTKKITILADRIVQKALDGDVPAFNAVADRVEGKPTQALEHSGPEGGPVFLWGAKSE